MSIDFGNANKENGSTLKECRHFRQRIRRWQSRIYWQDRVISPERTLGFVIRRDTDYDNVDAKLSFHVKILNGQDTRPFHSSKQPGVFSSATDRFRDVATC